MNDVLQTIGSLSGLSQIVLVVLFVLIYGKDIKDVVLKLLRRKNGEEPEPEAIPIWAEQLLRYFNHDTTEYHKITGDELRKLQDKMEQHNDLERDNNIKLQEIIKYGVPCREKR